MTESLVVCSKCGAVNRLPPTRPAIDPKCVKCKTKIFTGHPENVAAEIFARQIARSTMPVLVDVWAPWCGPCLSMAPAYEAAAREPEPQVRLWLGIPLPTLRTASMNSLGLSHNELAKITVTLNAIAAMAQTG